jgi:hypothetical protein
VTSGNWVTIDFDKILGVNSEERGLNFFTIFRSPFLLDKKKNFPKVKWLPILQNKRTEEFRICA